MAGADAGPQKRQVEHVFGQHGQCLFCACKLQNVNVETSVDCSEKSLLCCGLNMASCTAIAYTWLAIQRKASIPTGIS